jgi:outer membrane protein assembly factor BamA
MQKQIHVRLTGWLLLLASLSLFAGDLTLAEEKDKKEKDPRALEWVVAPIPVVEPNFGNGLAAIGLILVPLSKKDTVSNKSVFGAGGFYTDTNSWGALAGGRMFIDENRFRVDGGVGYFELNYDFYGIGNEAGDRNRSIPIEQKGPGVALGFLIRVKGDWYLGPRYRIFSVDTRVDLSASGLPEWLELPESVQEETSSGFLGAQLLFNTKDYEFNPTSGTLFDFRADFFAEAVGSDFRFQKYTALYNRYLPLGDQERQVIAVRGTACGVAGEAPFFELCAIGSADAFRGYTTGRYRDDTSVTAQAEYRWQFWRSFGVVFFGGVAQVASSLSDFSGSNWLPAAGTGLRWMAAKQSRINVRIDYAWGQDDRALYILVGEAF